MNFIPLTCSSFRWLRALWHSWIHLLHSLALHRRGESSCLGRVPVIQSCGGWQKLFIRSSYVCMWTWDKEGSLLFLAGHLHGHELRLQHSLGLPADLLLLGCVDTQTMKRWYVYVQWLCMHVSLVKCSSNILPAFHQCWAYVLAE